ncbi:MAPEG family protein [Hephaestia sp. GCM10023244]|uniref:MAPEG family protein n=1 Tax=unclassified Hephaestia TaxID=2631281 RepID=UPI0020771E75|nr:MAPEG family protein [Hephaestia sp. MAHUQ-44]MCM8730953.1 MAPEG family protein [Hephaestia sp. MAHUQ-44]
MALIILPVTLVTAGGAALINAWLAWRIGTVRRTAAVSIGDGGNLALATRMRAQANFVENAPFIIILIGLIEFAQGSSIWLWAVSAVFLIARVGHALGMEGLRYGRMVGTIVTMLLLVVLGIYAVLLPFHDAPRTQIELPIESLRG